MRFSDTKIREIKHLEKKQNILVDTNLYLVVDLV